MPFHEVIYEVENRVCTITLNRPDKLNALTQVMENELFQAMKQANEDSRVRVIILTGAGRGFCAGADLSLLQSIQAEDLDSTPPKEILSKYVPNRPIGITHEDFQRSWTYFLAVEKPILCAINGPAVGLGFIIPLFCDIRFASEQAKFSTAFAQRGLIAEHGISWILPRLIGISNALDLLFTAKLITAEEAAKLNLVSRVFPPDDLLAKTKEYAQQLATTVSPRSLRFMKKEAYQALHQSLAEAVDQANQDMLASFQSNDFKEGVQHFLENRAPNFNGD